MDDSNAGGRRTLLIIGAVFFGPIAVALMLYLSGDNWRPAGRTEHGILFEPPRQLPASHLVGGPEETVASGFSQIWTLLYVGDSRCDEFCAITLVNMRQLRLSLGPDMPRVQRVVCLSGDDVDTVTLRDEHPGLMTCDPESAAAIRQVVGDYEPGDIFLVDPLANLVMRYPVATELGAMRKDVKLLLKLSGIG